MEDLYFSDQFGLDPAVLDSYGAFDISLVSDLPLFIDPFLLFHSPKPEYHELHAGIITYLRFLRDKAGDDLAPGLIDQWYRFGEVEQNWLGFTFLGNKGHGLGRGFATALNESLHRVLTNFGSEEITKGSHLEKLALIKPGVGRDSISDFATNLIKGYLLDYTQEFASRHLDDDKCEEFAVERAVFNYTTQAWETRTYRLPSARDDYVLLTPVDMLTRDDTWISHSDMIGNFHKIPPAVSDEQLRAKVNNYFASRLGDKPTKKDSERAAQRTILEFPELIDIYIRSREDDGDRAVGFSSARRDETKHVLVGMVKKLVSDLSSRTDLLSGALTSYDEAFRLVHGFKQYIENQDGYRLINRDGNEKPFSNESDVQLFFGLTFLATRFDLNREPNNGRGPVDFKVSEGAFDKSLIEFKLASNTQLKRNLQKQVQIYEAANQTRSSVKVIIFYTQQEQEKVQRILSDLKLTGEESIVVIDARADNKPSASKA